MNDQIAHRRVAVRFALVVIALLTALAVRARAQGAATMPMNSPAAVPVATDLGMLAPDFLLPSALADGRVAETRLSALRGRVVVIAFYPGDKTTGCTAELSKFRNEYTSLFDGDVTVLPISSDDMASHAAWSAEMHFPFALLSDTSQAVALDYGSAVTGRKYDSRTVFVVGRDGRIAYRNLRFGALNESAYQELASAVRMAKGR